MNDKIITVKQLPVIEEHLQSISNEIKERVDSVLAMECNTDNYKEIKKYRTDMLKAFTDLEDRRKEVKKAVLSPYEQFEDIYKKYVTNVFKPADEAIKGKIQAVEQGIKEQKRADAEAYFNELAQSMGIDFVKFDSMGVEVSMSVSLKKLKETAQMFISKIVDDMELIAIQESREEILVEYKKTLNVSQAIRCVDERHRAVEEEKRRAEELRIEAEIRANAEAEADKAIEETAAETVISPPIVTDIQESAQEEAEEKVYSAAFKVFGNLAQLKALKEFMIKDGMRYEQL